MKRVIIACLFAAGCGGGEATSGAASTPATGMEPTAIAPGGAADGDERTVRVAWTDATATGGCFFFSGPPMGGVEVRVVHGGAATLRRDQDTLSLDFGGGVTFRGPTSNARLVRQETYDYQGKWEITETIAFDVVGDGAWSGTYEYEECEMDTGRACPGTCRIDARIAID